MDNAAETAFEKLLALLKAPPHSMRIAAEAVKDAIGGDAAGKYRQDPPDSDNWRILVLRGLQGTQRLAVLAHEAGHHFSRREGWSDSYKSVYAKPVDDWRGFHRDEQRAIIKEEVRAWQLGIALAVDTCGFCDRAALVRIGKTEFENYRSKVDPDVDDFDAALLRVGEPVPSPV